jgi:hypothetical protein
MGLSRPLAFEVFRTPYHFRKMVSGIALCVIRDVDIAASERGDDLLLANSNGPGSASRNAAHPRIGRLPCGPSAVRELGDVGQTAPKNPRSRIRPAWAETLSRMATPLLLVPRLTRNHGSAVARSFGITRLVHTCSAESSKSPDERIADIGCQC